jgi:hypothetical protein
MSEASMEAQGTVSRLEAKLQAQVSLAVLHPDMPAFATCGKDAHDSYREHWQATEHAQEMEASEADALNMATAMADVRTDCRTPPPHRLSVTPLWDAWSRRKERLR